MNERLQPPPTSKPGVTKPRPDDWSELPPIAAPVMKVPVAAADSEKPKGSAEAQDDDAENADLRREPMIEAHVDISRPLPPPPINEFEPDEPDAEADAARMRIVQNQAMNARRAAMDPDDGMEV